MNTARFDLAGAGTQTAGLAFGGDTPVRSAATEEYNGATWTQCKSFNTARSSLGGVELKHLL
jgi:hypothetical protein